MRRLLPLLLLAAAGCGSPRRDLPAASATVTLFGERGRLETWEVRALAGDHLHARGGDGSCLAIATLFRTMTGAAAESGPEPQREAFRRLGDSMAVLAGEMCVATLGRGYGGKDLLALSLRPSAESAEALFVVVPNLAEGQAERTYRPPEILAEYLSPLDRVEASLDSGRVHVRRGGEVELFLVLRPSGAAAPYERLQVVARVFSGAPR